MTWLVVGASSGLGRALAGSLAEASRDLLLVASDRRDIEAVAADLAITKGAKVETVAADATHSQAFVRAVEAALDTTERLEGIFFPMGAVAAADGVGSGRSLIEDLVAVNLLSVMALTSRLVPRIIERGGGLVVGFGSVAAVRGRSTNVAYSVAKSGLRTYFESLRHAGEPHGLRVQYYILGYLDTNLAYGKRLLLPRASPQNVARLVVSNLGKGSTTRYCPRFWAPVAAAVWAIPWGVYRRVKF